MNKIIKTDDAYIALIEECVSLLVETRFDLALKDIEWRHKLGETIAKSSLLEKHATGRGQFIENVAKDIGLSKSLVYQCIEFYGKYPQGLSTFIETFSPEKKILKWSDVRVLLSDGDQKKAECKHKEKELEVLTIERLRCSACGKIVKESKQIKSIYD